MRQSFSDDLFREAFASTAGFTGVPKARYDAAENPDDLLDCPGVSLKSVASSKGWPKHFGILVKYGDSDPSWIDEVIVMSKEPGPRCVWLGTFEEYRKMWRVD